MQERLGVETYTVRDYIGDRKQVGQTLAKIKAIGYDCIQMDAPEFLTTKDFKAMLDDAGLATCCVSINYPETVTDLAPHAKRAHELNCADVFFDGTIWANLRETETGFRAYAHMLNEAGRLLKKEGLRAHYHFHALEFVKFASGRTGIEILLEETEPGAVYFMPDTHWIQAGGKEPSRFLKRFRGRTTQVHFKDYGINPAVTSIEQVNKLFAEVGEGTLEWPDIIRSCREINVEYYIVEQDICRHDPFESLRISYENMKKFGL